MPNCECYGAGACRACKAERALNEAGSKSVELTRLRDRMQRIHAICVAVTVSDSKLSDLSREMVNRIGELSREGAE